jgi:hypothetical protein
MKVSCHRCVHVRSTGSGQWEDMFGIFGSCCDMGLCIQMDSGWTVRSTEYRVCKEEFGLEVVGGNDKECQAG